MIFSEQLLKILIRDTSEEMEYESPSQSPHLTMDERLKMLYPMVNEDETPLPRCWSTKVMHYLPYYF